MKKKHPDFNDHISVIDAEIAKKRYKWNLNSLAWMDFDDVAQIIRIHIYKKWSQYDPEKPLQPWLNTIITHQICNLVRNHYSNYARPCLRCDAAEDTNGCKIYGTQCENCPLYADWKKRKLSAYNIKIPVTIENHSNEVSQISDQSNDISKQISRAHIKMKEILKPIEYQVYEGLFILHEDEEIVAKKIGYVNNEKNGRGPGYKQINNIRRVIIEKFKNCIEKGDIDIF